MLTKQRPTLARCAHALRSAFQVLGLFLLRDTTKSATTRRYAATSIARLRHTTAIQQPSHTAVATCCTSCGPWGIPTGTVPLVIVVALPKIIAQSAFTITVQKQRARAVIFALPGASSACVYRCTLQDQIQTVAGIVQLATPLPAHSYGRATGAASMLGTRPLAVP